MKYKKNQQINIFYKGSFCVINSLESITWEIEIRTINEVLEKIQITRLSYSKIVSLVVIAVKSKQ